MTVNIGLVTSDALVLGCDSVASTTGYLLDPLGMDAEQGKDGKFTLKFDYADLRPVVTSAWGGVTKMFQIHPDPSPVVAVTSGLAKLQDRTIASHAEEFLRWRSAQGRGMSKPRQLVNVEPICNAFLNFMRRRYQAHYRGSPIPTDLREGPEFLVGGIGRDDAFPSLYRVSIQRNSVAPHFVGGKTGVAWGGQSGAVERFIRGYDASVRSHIEKTILEALTDHNAKALASTTDLVNNVLDKLDEEWPDGLKVTAPRPGKVNIDWDDFAVEIDYANLPIQEAVNFVATLVMFEASRARFAIGIATVGGRTHIGVVTKAKGFKVLNEPDLVHRFTGLSSDA